MIYITTTRQAYDQEAINKLGWVRRDYNIADSLLKILVNEIMKTFIIKGSY